MFNFSRGFFGLLSVLPSFLGPAAVTAAASSDARAPGACRCGLLEWHRNECCALYSQGWDTLPFLSFPVADQGSHGFYEIAEQAGTVKAGDVRDLFKVTPWARGRVETRPFLCAVVPTGLSGSDSPALSLSVSLRGPQ